MIDDINLPILTEDEINAELEDLEANDALDDADQSEITGMQEGNPECEDGDRCFQVEQGDRLGQRR